MKHAVNEQKFELEMIKLGWGKRQGRGGLIWVRNTPDSQENMLCEIKEAILRAIECSSAFPEGAEL